MLLQLLYLILNSLVCLLAGVLLLRFWMQAIRIRPPSPVAEFTFQLTDWLVLRLRRIVPGIGGYDWASLLATVFLAMLMAILQAMMSPAGLVWPLIVFLALHKLITWICYGFIGAVLLSVIFSWVNPYAPLAPFVNALTAPLLRPIRRLMPSFGNIDLSPMVLGIILMVVMQLNDGLLVMLLGSMTNLLR